MIDFLVTLAVVALLQASGQAPQTAPAPGQTDPSNAERSQGRTTEQDDNRVICRRERVLGSNRSEQICMTVAQRNASRQRSSESRDRLGRDVTRDGAISGQSSMSPGATGPG